MIICWFLEFPYIEVHNEVVFHNALLGLSLSLCVWCVGASIYVCMSLRTYAFIYVHIYVNICRCMYACMHMSLDISMHLCIYAYMCVCINASMSICMHACMFTSIHAFICVYMGASVHMYTYVYICVCLYVFSTKELIVTGQRLSWFQKGNS